MDKLKIILPFLSWLFLVNTNFFIQNTVSGFQFSVSSCDPPSLFTPDSRLKTQDWFADTCVVLAKFSPGQDTVVTNGNPVLITNQSLNANSYSWSVNGSNVSSGKDLAANPVVGVNEIMLVASNGICMDTAYSYIIWDLAGLGQVSMKKQFSDPGLSIEPLCIASDKGNGYLLAGDYFPPKRENFESKTTCLVRIDENGCVIWCKAMAIGEEEVIQSIISTSDSGFLVSAFPFQPQNANYSNSLLVFKLDKQGNAEWNHAYNGGSSVNNYFSSICETSDKGFVLEMGSFPSGSNPSFLSIVKIDQQGNLTWGHKLSVEDNAFYNIGGIIEKNGFIYSTGSIYEATSPYHLIRSFLVQSNFGAGQTNWTKQNDPLQTPLSFTDVHNYKKGLLINSYTNNSLNDLIYTDNDGNVLTSRIINSPYGSLNGKGNILVTADNGVYFHQPSGLPPDLHKDVIMRLDSAQQIAWQYDFYSQDLSFAGWYQLTQGPANGMAGIGSGMTADGLEAITFLKLDSSGSGCSSGESNLSISTTNSSLIPMTWNTDTDLPLTITSPALHLETFNIESHLFCSKYVNGCDLLKLDGPKVLCQLGDKARFILHTDPACVDPVSWTYDSANISVLSKGQAFMEVNFKKEGSYIIKVKKNECNILTDSIIVTVGNHISSVHLPKDTTLCFGESLLLDAGYGYESYQWQDGSDQQSISVTVPGTYWVKLAGMNGCAITDTTSITTITPLPAHFLPPHTVICTYEMLSIQLPPSYTSYLWSTGETTSFIQVKDQGVYTLQVVDKNGCEGKDTIRVTTKNCPFGIFFPNAFTPNKDGRNDLFRPVVLGNPVKYHFSIYTRWGQRIFDTGDPKKGWDGRIGGQEQESNSYVWTCIYQFRGEKQNKKNGNFILIR